MRLEKKSTFIRIKKMFNVYLRYIQSVYEKCTTCIKKSQHVFENMKKNKKKRKKTS